MTTTPNSSWRRDLHTIFSAGTLAGLSDGQLLERIATLRGAANDAETEVEAASGLLVERHGPMVLRVCKSELLDPHDADDAFQATFLVLLRRAGSIRKRESVGSWLHGVAHRVAACARSAAARRRRHERRLFARRDGTSPAESNTGDLDDFELSRTIHGELERLPERYRAPIVLCDLEERSLDEAARQLGWPLGTVKSRLNRGRQRLRERLVRRGVTPGMVPVTLSSSALSHSAARAVAFSPVLADAMTQMLANAGAGNEAISATVLAFAKAVERIFLMGKLKIVAAGLFVVGLAALGIGNVARGPRQAPRDDTPAKASAAEAGEQAAELAKGDNGKGAAPARTGIAGTDDSRIELIEISGRAADSTGRPVAGAMVYIIDTNHRWSNRKSRLLATAKTRPDGRFIARGVELTVWKPDPSPLPSAEEGRFQVAGTASGFGFAWHEVTSYRPGERPRAAARPDVPNAEAFYRGEPISIDLSFGPPATLKGRIVDDRGRPLAGVKVQVGCCDDLRRPGIVKAWSCARVNPTDTIPRERRAFDGIHTMPEELFSARTGADGGYHIDSLPRDAEFLTSIDPGPEYEAMAETIATADKPLQNIRSLGHSAVLDHAFTAPRDVRLSVRYADTNLPAKSATVRAKSSRALLRAGGIGTTDESGRSTLRLRPGEYELAIEPPIDAPYRPGREIFKIGPDDDAKTADFRLEPAAIVMLEAVDAKTGAGIEGVRFQYDTDTTRQRRDVASQLVVIDHPVTDERGRLRAIVEPGSRRFFVESVPPGWKFESTSNEFVPLVAGREITGRFAFTKLEQPADNATATGPSAIFPKELVETWKRQEQIARTGKFWVRQYYLQSADPIPWDDLEAFLNMADSSRSGELVSGIRARFSGFGDPGVVICQIVTDGRRLRNNYRYPQGRETSVSVANGLETIDYRGDSAQADICEARNGSVHVMGVSDFSYSPNVTARPRRPKARTANSPTIRRTEGADGRLTIEVEAETSKARWVVDRKTGFVHAHSQQMNKARSGSEVRQYGPKVFESGAVIPSVFVEATILENRVSRVWIRSVENVELSYKPTLLDFVVAAPAGTVILDYREDRAHPKQGMNKYPVADVIAFADGLTSRNRSIDPVLSPGQPAPPFRPASWLDLNGPIAAPDLTGKVVLVDFWGIGCGPCVAELPDVQAAANHFVKRSKDFALVGLHDSGATVEQVAQFVRKRGLTYPIAVDRPAGKEGWFGATFKDYGVRGIPAAAVIDRQGKIVFVGRFSDAIQKAADLLAQ